MVVLYRKLCLLDFLNKTKYYWMISTFSKLHLCHTERDRAYKYESWLMNGNDGVKLNWKILLYGGFRVEKNRIDSTKAVLQTRKGFSLLWKVFINFVCNVIYDPSSMIRTCFFDERFIVSYDHRSSFKAVRRYFKLKVQGI